MKMGGWRGAVVTTQHSAGPTPIGHLDAKRDTGVTAGQGELGAGATTTAEEEEALPRTGYSGETRIDRPLAVVVVVMSSKSADGW